MLLDTVRGWVGQVLDGLMDAKKQETLANVVAGAVESQSLVIGDIGRGIPGNSFDKHKIKRVDRFLSNAWIDVTSISLGLVRGFEFAPGQRVLLALDWTHLGKFEGMSTSVVTGEGRALPFHWTVIDQKKTRLALGQKRHVEDLLALLPDGVEFILLFDAGFDDVDFLRHLQELGLKFVVRSSPQVCVRRTGEDRWTHLRRHDWGRGVLHDWGDVEFTKDHKLLIRFVAIHDHGQEDPWLLLTNLQDHGRTVVRCYGRRFETEEAYKDYKDLRSAFKLKGTRIKDADRLKRLVVTMSVAYLLLVCAGLYGEDLGLHRQMQTNTVKHKRVLALWRVGRNLVRRGRVGCQELLRRLRSRLQTLGVTFGGEACPAYG